MIPRIETLTLQEEHLAESYDRKLIPPASAAYLRNTYKLAADDLSTALHSTGYILHMNERVTGIGGLSNEFSTSSIKCLLHSQTHVLDLQYAFPTN